MTQQDFQTLVDILRWRYGEDFLTDEQDLIDWYNEFLTYPFPVVDRAVRYYCEARDTRPTLDAFLISLDVINRGDVDEFFRMKSEAFVGCKRCNDHGFYFVDYPTGVEFQEECDCKSKDQKFAILDEEHQMYDNECFAKFGFGLRSLDRNRVKVIRRPRIQLFKNRGWEGLNFARKVHAAHDNSDSMAERPVVYDVVYE